MVITRNSDTRITLKKDMAGLFNIPVNIENDTSDFIFDTGANISVIDKTLATKYGVKILGDSVNVGNPTGKTINAEVGLLNIKLGDIDIKNVVFLVFPDSALTFAHGAYVIKGIIGFPIMYALQEFTVKNNQVLIIPKTPEKTSVRNFDFDGLTLDIMVQYKNDTLPFHFDSGADRTALYSTFFKKYHDDIIKNCKKTTTRFAGVGSQVKIDAYLLDSAQISAGNSQGTIDSLYIQTTNLQGASSKYVYGNLGQDYIKQFSEMKINFASMEISFSGKK
jgi:clan AA aspartic protease (TIGR02281 family)